MWGTQVWTKAVTVVGVMNSVAMSASSVVARFSKALLDVIIVAYTRGRTISFLLLFLLARLT